MFTLPGDPVQFLNHPLLTTLSSEHKSNLFCYSWAERRE
jgi:hypothetical protein